MQNTEDIYLHIKIFVMNLIYARWQKQVDQRVAVNELVKQI